MVETWLCVVNIVTGQFNLFVDQQGLWMITTTGQQLETARNIAFQSLAHFDRVVFYHTHFQSRGTADNVFCFGCILYPRQLYDDAVEAGLLDDRLSHAQLIDAIMQSSDVLFHRIGAYFVNRFFG